MKYLGYALLFVATPLVLVIGALRLLFRRGARHDQP